jgi:pyruvate/2-oxoglutarate dehydrogenase complex dihydrolipoamide acyltransferase (E2) component
MPFQRDELIVEIETDKVVMEVVAPANGVLEQILAKEGDTIESEAVLAVITEGAGAAADKPQQVRRRPRCGTRGARTDDGDTGYGAGGAPADRGAPASIPARSRAPARVAHHQGRRDGGH